MLYWMRDPEQFALAARRAIEDADRLIISSISAWEFGLKVKRGKLAIPLPISEYADRLERLDGLEIRPVDRNCWTPVT